MHPLNILYCKPAYIRDDFISRFNYRKNTVHKNPQTKKTKKEKKKKPRDCNENKDFSASM